jgi:membrane protein implicated in regulation of membrane protease activity
MIFGLPAWLFWLILSVFFIIIEVFTVNLISIWFALGSIVALGLSLFGASIPIQVALFLLVSMVAIGAFLLLRKRLHLTYNRIEKTNADRNVGKSGIVTQTINNLQNEGLVKIGGQIWSAISADQEIIPEGSTVTVSEIKGVKIIVYRSVNHDPNETK